MQLLAVSEIQEGRGDICLAYCQNPNGWNVVGTQWVFVSE